MKSRHRLKDKGFSQILNYILKIADSIDESQIRLVKCDNPLSGKTQGWQLAAFCLFSVGNLEQTAEIPRRSYDCPHIFPGTANCIIGDWAKATCSDY